MCIHVHVFQVRTAYAPYPERNALSPLALTMSVFHVETVPIQHKDIDIHIQHKDVKRNFPSPVCPFCVVHVQLTNCMSILYVLCMCSV